jgi:hypothetical protein
VSDDERSEDPPDPGTEDPFEQLASEIDREAAFGDDAGEDGSEFDEEAFSIGGGASDAGGASPFDELDSDVEDVDLEELFEEQFTEGESGEFDSEAVWDRIDETDTGEEEETAADEHVVSARNFCAQCEHAAEPPEVHCTYEGSQIVEFVDKSNVRVRNCPIVAQRRQIGRKD